MRGFYSYLKKSGTFLFLLHHHSELYDFPFITNFTYDLKQQFLHQFITDLAKIVTVCQVWYV